MPSDLKPGDRVHVEFDGTIHSAAGTFVAVTKEAGNTTYTVPWSAVTLIEPPRPEWADRTGAVVLDRNGSAWQRGNYNWHRPPNVSCIYDELVDLFGPLTLLRDPVGYK